MRDRPARLPARQRRLPRRQVRALRPREHRRRGGGEGTLIVPTIFDADRKGLGTIATESRALAEKVRDGKISPPELSGATFSITNLGMYGVTHFTAVINPPQSAILAVGKMEPKPVVRDGESSPATR